LKKETPRPVPCTRAERGIKAGARRFSGPGGPVTNTTDGKMCRCFPRMSGWIADHMANVTLHAIKSNACPKCQVPPDELGSGACHHCATDDARYERYERENPSLDSETHNAAHARYTKETHVIKRGQNLVQGLVRVSTPDLHKPDMLHTIYLALFKPMIDWIPGFLKNMRYSRLPTTPAKLCPLTQDSLSPKRPPGRLHSSKETR